MPFGVKTDGAGNQINFDAIYHDAIAPAIEDAGMEPLRADEERDGGIIHKPMLERLVLCSFAVSDLTLANANVFYELGVRHAVRPHTTVLLFATGSQRLPFDVAPLRALPYTVDDAGVLTDGDRLRAAIRSRLDAARDPAADSPLYQLLEGFGPPDVARLKTDVFRDRVRYSVEAKKRLETARHDTDDAQAAIRLVHESLRPLADQDAAIAIDLMLSYRDVKDYNAMIATVNEMAAPVAASVLVREQLGFALNRAERHREAEKVLKEVLADHGPSSETLGLLGRVYKDLWTNAKNSFPPAAPAFLGKAIDAYRRGFEADWRDSYPGINAVTLMEVQNPGQPAIAELVPVVRYSSLRRVAQTGGDYWDKASLLELAVLERRDDHARSCFGEALAEHPEGWKKETTANNLELIAVAREDAGEDTALLRSLIANLTVGGGVAPN